MLSEIRFLLAIGLFGVVTIGCSQQKQTDSRFVFPKASPSELTKPIEISRGGFFSDMGSVGVQLRGANGKETYLFFSQNEWESEDYLGARLYLGLPPDAVLVERKSQVEAQVIELLEDGIDQKYDELGVSIEERTNYPTTIEQDDLTAAKGILGAVVYSADPALVYVFESEDDPVSGSNSQDDR